MHAVKRKVQLQMADQKGTSAMAEQRKLKSLKKEEEKNEEEYFIKLNKANRQKWDQEAQKEQERTLAKNQLYKGELMKQIKSNKARKQRSEERILEEKVKGRERILKEIKEHNEEIENAERNLKKEQEKL